MNIEEFKNTLYSLQGRTIAVVYIFENEDSPGYKHYDIWESDVISEWLNAIRENHCIPFIIDLRTFIFKATNGTLPKIDYVINLNNGNTNLSVLGLIPSVCNFLNIPCIPCNTVSIITGEHKIIANKIAKSIGLQIPSEMNNNADNIFRPICYGSSRGIKKFKTFNGNLKDGICQEFINGYDITTPILYNPTSERLEILPSVMYYSEDKDIKWFFNEDVKERRGGYKKRIVDINSNTAEKYLELAKNLEISCYCRIDARIKCNSSLEWEELFLNPISEEKIYFIEINPMPTLKHNINFFNSLNSIKNNNSFYNAYEAYKKLHNCSSSLGFILMCSMISNLQPCVKEKRINPILTNEI